ncbi:MAG: DUF3048 domain-containing protein [Clostridiales bacterium]|nr:DUF3048 domain-containing protein [Clostridiales bacterium]
MTNETGFDAEMLYKRPVAIMVNNHPKARPQWGLNSADVVMEFCVEAGVTRMMWLFADYNDIPEKVGPIRSARTYFVQMAQSMDAIFVHWGGSDTAYELINQINMDDIDGMHYSDVYFFRDTTRSVAIEHRGVSSGDRLRQAIADLNQRTDLGAKELSPFVFSGDEVSLSGSCKRILASFSDEYKRAFTYSEADELYYNYLNGNAFVDSTGEQHAVSNVLVLFAPTPFVSSDLVKVDLTGGSGYYATNGTYQAIKWTKGSNTSQELELFYEDGTPVELNTGKSWIGFVPSDRIGKTEIS